MGFSFKLRLVINCTENLNSALRELTALTLEITECFCQVICILFKLS